MAAAAATTTTLTAEDSSFLESLPKEDFSNGRNPEPRYDEAELFVNSEASPALHYQAVCAAPRTSVISSEVSEKGKALGWGKWRVRKGPMMLEEALTIVTTQHLLKRLGMPFIDCLAVYMTCDPTIKAGVGQRTHLRRGHFVLMEDLAIKGGMPNEAKMPWKVYVNESNANSPWNPLKAKVVNKYKLVDWTSAADYPNCSQSVFKCLLLRIILGFADFADRNIIVTKSNGEAHLIDTDIFHQTDFFNLKTYVRGYEKQVGVQRAALEFDRSILTTWLKELSSSSIRELLHSPRLATLLFGWHSNTFATPDAFLAKVKTRIEWITKNYEEDFKNGMVGEVPKKFQKKDEKKKKEKNKSRSEKREKKESPAKRRKVVDEKIDEDGDVVVIDG